ETREAVLTVVRERGFSTNRSARALSGGRTGLVGLATPFLNAPYFAAILEGADEALYEQDIRIVMCSTHHRHDREVTLLDRLMHGTTDGAILLLPEETNEELEALQRKRYPFVVVDPRVPLAPGIPSVSAAHTSGARERGLRVPEDVSVVGFDDVDNAAMVTPALTTVRQPLEEMGRMAVSLLTRLIERQPVEALHVELATRLVIRESTAPPPR